MAQAILVKAAYDADAAVWFIESSDLPGLNLEAATIEELSSKIPLAVVDLLETSEIGGGDFDIPIEIVAHASLRARGRYLVA